MIRALLLFPLLLLAAPARAGGDPSDGHTHGTEGASMSVTPSVVTTTAMTARFEAVLKHAPVRGGQPYAGTLYLADYPTNAPVSGATLTLQGLGLPDGGAFTVEATADPGTYLVRRPQGFPADGTYDLALTVEAGGASDLLLLQRVYVGRVESPAEPVAEGTGASFPWVWLLVVLLLGGGLAAFLVRSARQRRAATDAAAPAPPTAPPAAPPAPAALPEPPRPARRDRPVAGPRT